MYFGLLGVLLTYVEMLGVAYALALSCFFRSTACPVEVPCVLDQPKPPSIRRTPQTRERLLGVVSKMFQSFVGFGRKTNDIPAGAQEA